MTADTPKVTVHMVSSLDGFIAKKDGSVSWLESSDTYEKGVTGESAEEFIKTIDCFVMGSRTYEHALELSLKFRRRYTMREISLTLVLIIPTLFCGSYYLVREEPLTGIGWLLMSLTGFAALGFVIWKQRTKKEYSEIPAIIRYTATLGPLGAGVLLIAIDSFALIFN